MSIYDDLSSLSIFHDRFSWATLRKVEPLVSSGNLRQDPEYAQVWWVYRDGYPYRVSTDWLPGQHLMTWVTCTCPYGLARGSGAEVLGSCVTRCYHAASVLHLLETSWLVNDHKYRGVDGEGRIVCACDPEGHVPALHRDHSQHLAAIRSQERSQHSRI